MRYKKKIITIWILLISSVACGHVPYIEGKDYLADNDFKVENILQSKAFYAYLDAAEVDIFVMQVDEPVPIYVNMLIPFCKEYAEFATMYALTGPGLPQPAVNLPVELAVGHGAIVWDPSYAEDWSERPLMYEMFSDRQYFEGISHRYDAELPGEYRVIVWHPQQRAGDYLVVIGKTEEFSPAERKQAYANVPLIRNHEELVGACTYEGDFSKWFLANNN
jgi:hypothetical protein